MTKFQIEINKRILKVFFLADIIEAEIEAINPVGTIDDTETMVRLESLKISCERYRKKIDSSNEEFGSKLGEISDMLDDAINDLTKDW